MFRIDNATAAAALPAPTAAGVNPDHFFTDGDPLVPIPPTIVDAEWANMVQEELVAVIVGAGLALNKADRTQLRAAITAMISGASKAVVIQGAVFGVSVVDGAAVYWDGVNNRFDEALADGTAIDLAVGIADVTNGEVICFGETRAGLVAGLTPGSKYYLDEVTVGGLVTAAPVDRVTVGIAKAATVLFVDIDSHSGELRKDVSETLTVGMLTASNNLGNLAAATTLTIAAGTIQNAVMTGAFTLTAPNDVDQGAMVLELTVGGVGGYALGLVGFSQVSGVFNTVLGTVNVLKIIKLPTKTTLEIVQAG